MRKLKMLTIASVIALGSSVAMAAPGMGFGNGQGAGYHHNMNKTHKGSGANHFRGGMGAGMGMFAGIALTPEQQQKIQVIYYEGQAKLAAMPRVSATDTDAYRNLITADKFDEAQVRAQLETNTKAQIDRRLAMAKVHYDMYQVLTSEQKAQMKTNYETRMANFKQRMENGGHRGAGMGHMAGMNPNCPNMPR